MVSKSKHAGIGRPKKDRSDYELIPSSADVRKMLAARARARRKSLNLTAAEVATRIGIVRTTLVEWEKEMPSHLAQAQARQWEAALTVPQGWLTKPDMETPVADGRPLVQLLGDRAQRRRMKTGLTQKYLEDSLGLPRDKLRRWEAALPRRLPREVQQRWEAALQVPRGWLYDLSMDEAQNTAAKTNVAKESTIYRTLPASAEVRMALAFRAAERRTIIGLGVKELGAMIGIRPHALTTFEEEMPEQLLEEQAAKWEQALEAPHGWLGDLAIIADPPVALQSDWPSYGTVYEAIIGVASWLSRPRLRERSFHYSELSQEEKRRVDILLRRYGIPSGRPGIEAAAAAFGASKYEVSQVSNAMADRAQGLDGKRLDPLDELPGMIAPLLPSSAEVLEAKLSGILGGVSLDNAELFCKSLLSRTLFGRQDDLVVVSGREVKEEDNEILRLVRSMAARLMRGAGAVQIHTLYGLVADASSKPVSAKDLLRTVGSLPGFEWLDETTGWFWVEPYSSSKVQTVAIKILAACGTAVDAKEVTQGIARSAWKLSDGNAVYHAFTPPEFVVAAILGRLPVVKINHKLEVVLTSPVSPTECLSGSEMSVLRCIQNHSGIASWSQLKIELVDGGAISLAALNLALTNSPIVRKIDSALYSIRGMRFDGSAFNAAHSTCA